ncbi:M48 family metallopeptidase [Candidatus Micrarchaeota archaeon]|nr:M48 family metallopeptidase [Candidatus Micrarchaeota archaeon]
MYDQISQNKMKSYLYIAFFVLLIYVLAFVFGTLTGFGEGITVIAVGLAVVMTVGTYYYSDKIVLSTVGARIAEKKEFPYLYNTVEGLSIAAGIPMPRLFVIDNDAINAFATGRDPKNAIIVVNTGAIKKLNRQELEGVIAHEMSHIKNYDIRMMMLAAVMVGAIAIISDIMLRSGFRGGDSRKGGGAILLVGLVLAILSPIFAKLVQLAISRKREYLADASGALLTRYPEGLASALSKIKNDSTNMPNVSEAVAPLFISNPLNKRFLGNLFSTHPPLDDRIAILRKM